MSNEHDPATHDSTDAATDDVTDADQTRVDSFAKAAGAALRQPPPADGMARLQSSRRRRQTVRAVAGGTAVAALAVAIFAVVGRDDSGDGVVITPPPSSVETGPTVVDPTDTTITPDTTPTSAPVSTPDTATSEPTISVPTDSTDSTDSTDASTTTSMAPGRSSTWQATTTQFPSLSYIACCGTDWEGEASPPVPADPNAPLAAGIYNGQAPRTDGIEIDDDIADGVLTVELRPYGRCDDAAAAVRCSGNEPFPANALGVRDEPARVLDIALDDSVRVAVSGFGCDGPANTLLPVRELGTGADLLDLYTELEADYEIAVGAPLRNGVDAAQLAADIAANSPNGFFDPNCPAWTQFAWTPEAGPTVLAPLNLYTGAGLPAPQPDASIAIRSMYPTAIGVDDAGTITIYLYAGFLS